MRSLKAIIPTLILILIVYVLFFAFHAPKSIPQKLNVLGASNNVVLYEQPDSGHQPILDALSSAQQEIDVEVYLLSDKQIIASLIDACGRGIVVNVILEEHPFGGGNLNPKTKDQLDASNCVRTQWANPSFALTHEKAIVIDKAEAFILSQNLTAASFSKNREYDVLDTNPQDVLEVYTIFQDDWQRIPFAPPSTSNIIESPDNSRIALTTLVTSAKEEIDAETEDINDDSFIATLINKARTIHVKLLTPTLSQLSANKDALEQLEAGGVEVKTISHPYMHAKMIVADNNKAYVGSINFSAQSMDRNRELGIILTDSEALQTLSSTFEADWNSATTLHPN